MPGVPMTDLRETVQRFWATAEARDWTASEATLAEDVVYTLPQTRERISGRERYVRFNREYPGDWHLRTERIVAAPDQVVSWVHCTVAGGDARRLLLHGRRIRPYSLRHRLLARAVRAAGGPGPSDRAVLTRYWPGCHDLDVMTGRCRPRDPALRTRPVPLTGCTGSC